MLTNDACLPYKLEWYVMQVPIKGFQLINDRGTLQCLLWLPLLYVQFDVARFLFNRSFSSRQVDMDQPCVVNMVKVTRFIIWGGMPENATLSHGKTVLLELILMILMDWTKYISSTYSIELCPFALTYKCVLGPTRKLVFSIINHFNCSYCLLWYHTSMASGAFYSGGAHQAMFFFIIRLKWGIISMKSRQPAITSHQDHFRTLPIGNDTWCSAV